jgi:hypothetical protein
MSKMSELDLMFREGDRTAEDFIARGFGVKEAEAMERVVMSQQERVVSDLEKRIEKLEAAFAALETTRRRRILNLWRRRNVE